MLPNAPRINLVLGSQWLLVVDLFLSLPFLVIE